MRLRGPRQKSRIPRPVGIVISLAAIGVVWAAVTFLTPAGPPLLGRATAVDGDTLRVGSARVRLTGLDAVELDQSCTDATGAQWACGHEARAYLARLLRDGDVACTPSGRDRYRRVLARCMVGNADVGLSIVTAGWAVAESDYALAEQQARGARSGIWAGQFERPADWRRDHGEPGFDLAEWLRSWFE